MNAQAKIEVAAPAVYGAIAKVSAQLAKDGIGKDRKNTQQGYNFRGIDDVYNTLAPVLASNRLCILPRMISRESVERQTQRGGALFYTTVEAEFDFVSADDGSRHTVRTFGEAMDSADKSTNKAMSAAYKYAAMQAFCIPTEGDNDADATTHDVAPRAAEQKPAPAKVSHITDDQVAQIITLTQQAGTDLKKLCAFYQIPSVAALPADKFDALVRKLNKDIAESKNAQSGGDILDDSVPY